MFKNILKKYKQKATLHRMTKSAIYACINGDCNTVIAISDTETLYVRKAKNKKGVVYENFCYE